MMIAPGALVMLTPLIVGFVFGVDALAGLLAGALVSGVQMAISAANTGGAWDNAKKYIESAALGDGHKKGSDTHKAAVVGDTVGDPLKDTSGPSLNIVSAGKGPGDTSDCCVCHARTCTYSDRFFI